MKEKGFVRSDTGEGIYYAMYSGVAAAESIKECIEEKEVLSKTYRSKLREHGLLQLYSIARIREKMLSEEEVEKLIDKIRLLRQVYGG